MPLSSLLRVLSVVLAHATPGSGAGESPAANAAVIAELAPEDLAAAGVAPIEAVVLLQAASEEAPRALQFRDAERDRLRAAAAFRAARDAFRRDPTDPAARAAVLAARSQFASARASARAARESFADAVTEGLQAPARTRLDSARRGDSSAAPEVRVLELSPGQRDRVALAQTAVARARARGIEPSAAVVAVLSELGSRTDYQQARSSVLVNEPPIQQVFEQE